MARIEELPDDFDESLKLNGSSELIASAPFPLGAQKTAQDDMTPSLPPQMASVRSHTADEIVQMMNKTPLFMTSLEETEGEEENVELEAIRAIQYEGTPAENAQNFKAQGNEMTKAKRWKDGQEFYTKGIAVLKQRRLPAVESSDHAKIARTKETKPEKEAEDRAEKQVEEACYVNRALCNLEMRNYRSTTLDCASALRLNPKNVKAYYRSSLALLALDKIDEASDACTRGLSVDPTNTSLANLNTKIKAREHTLTSIQKKKKEQGERAQRKRFVLNTALRARNIRARNTAQPPELEDASIHLSPDPLSPTSTIQFPVVILYPLHAQSDFIKSFPETDTIKQHVEYLFPLPWDIKQEYTLNSVDFYMETAKGGLIKAGKNMSLLKILGSGEVEIVDSIVRINVVIKERAQAWIEEMKARKGK